MQTSNTGGIQLAQNTEVSTGADHNVQSRATPLDKLEEKVKDIEGDVAKVFQIVEEKLEKNSEVQRNWLIGGVLFVFVSLLSGIAFATSFVVESFNEYKDSQTVLYNELKSLNKERMDDAIKYTKFYECIKNRKYWEYKLCTE